MYQIFKIFISVFWFFAIIIGIVIVEHSSFANKKRWKGCIIAAGIVLGILSDLLVQRVPFSSPEAAFIGTHPRSGLLGEELLTIEGDSSAWVQGNDTTLIVTKHGTKWSLLGSLGYSSPYLSGKDGISLFVDGPYGTGDYYICVTVFPVPSECRIESPDNTIFYERSTPTSSQDVPHPRIFYAYIGTLDSDYMLTVNGTTFRIPSASELGDPEPLWPQFLIQASTLAFLIAGSIGIIRIRTISRARKAVLIFVLILGTLFLGVFLTEQFVL